MYKNKQSRGEIVPWQPVIKHYHETRLVHSDKYKISHTKPIKIK